jgi:hypothetical protein
MSVTLIAYPLNSSNVEVPYVLDTSAEIDVALTFSAEDYSDLTKRRGAFSKTIVQCSIVCRWISSHQKDKGRVVVRWGASIFWSNEAAKHEQNCVSGYV